MQDSISNAIELPNRFDCYFLTKNENQVKLCGKQNNQITVYSLVNQKMQFEYSAPEKDSMSFPFAFYNTKNDDYIVIGRRNSIEVEHKIIKTSDNGNTWDIIKFKK